MGKAKSIQQLPCKTYSIAAFNLRFKADDLRTRAVDEANNPNLSPRDQGKMALDLYQKAQYLSKLAKTQEKKFFSCKGIKFKKLKDFIPTDKNSKRVILGSHKYPIWGRVPRLLDMKLVILPPRRIPGRLEGSL